jgi:superfamily II DNA or RNA helicase
MNQICQVLIRLMRMVQIGDTMSVQIIIQKGAHILNPPIELVQKVRKDLQFKNPLYENAKRYGKYAHQYMSPTLDFFSYNKEKNILYVPRGYVWYAVKYFKENGFQYEVKDKTTILERIDVEFKGELRDYQLSAVKDIIGYPSGVLEAGTGSGKTIMALSVIAKRKQPTLIIVHTKELFNQWNERIKSFLNYSPGMIGSGKYVVKDITVGIVQSVQNNMEELKDRFGHIIVDETHRCPSSTWTDVLSQFTARYFLGLSATHKVSKEKLHECGAVLKPVIIRVPTKFYCYYKGDHSELISNIAADNTRNRLIARTIRQDIQQFDSSVLIVSDRVEHCHAIHRELEALKVQSVVLTSATKKADRDRIVSGMRSGKYKVLLSTYQLIAEGFDLASLACVCLATPVTYIGKVVQVIGRVLRPEKGKTARVIDMRDDSVDKLLKMGKKRDTIYKKTWGISK